MESYGQTPTAPAWLLPVALGIGTIAVIAFVSGYASEKGRKRATPNRRRRISGKHSWREGPSEFAKRRSAEELRYAIAHDGGYGMTISVARKELKRRGLN
jgi:hypothetical protein